jgi:hypothetical protein
MSEFERDDLVGAVLTDVSREVSGYIRPIGAQAAVRTVRRRRRQRVVAGGVLAAALIIAPLTGLALAQDKPDPGPTVGTEVTAAPSPSLSEPGGALPSQATAAPSDAAGIPSGELSNATLIVPQWPAGPGTQDCPRGQVKFNDGVSSAGSIVRFVSPPQQVDVDHDGGPETMVRVLCRAQSAVTKVLVYDRANDGGIKLLGTVIGTSLTESSTTDVEIIWDAQVTTDGRIRVDVGDYAPCCGMPDDLPVHQERTYGWNGTGFVQTGGPTQFGPNPKTVDVRPSVPEITMVRQGDGRWRGTVRVQVDNIGPGPATPTLNVRMPVAVTMESGTAGCEVFDGSVRCSVERVAERGGQRFINLVLVSTVDPSGTAKVEAYEVNYPDVNVGNDKVDVRVRTA